MKTACLVYVEHLIFQICRSEEKSAPVHEDEEEIAQAEDEEENHDDQLLVPRVKVAEDGSIILDEERYKILLQNPLQ